MRRIRFLEVERDHWKEEAKKVGNDMKSKLYDAIARTADFKIDEIRLRLNQQPEGERVKEMVKEEAEVNDLTRFEMFKKWARENFTTLSVVMISVAGIITTGARSALKKGATATSKFGKAMAKLAEIMVGPVPSAALGLIAKILTLGAKGIAFLSKNLWILALMLTYLIYNEYQTRKAFKRNPYNKRMSFKSFESKVKFERNSAFTWGVKPNQFGGYSIPIVASQEDADKITNLVKEYDTKNPLYKSTLYLKCKELTTKQKDELLNKGITNVKIQYSITGVYTNEDGVNYLSFKVQKLGKSNKPIEVRECDIPEDY